MVFPFRHAAKCTSFVLMMCAISLDGNTKVIPPQADGLGYGCVNPAVLNATLDLTFDNYGATGFFDRQIENYILLAIDYDCGTYVADAAVKVGLEIKYYDLGGSFMSTETDTLRINHSNHVLTSDIDRALVIHEGAYRIWYKITSIHVNGVSTSSLPINMYIESKIVIERFFDFSSAASVALDSTSIYLTPGNVDCNVDEINDELLVTWPLMTEAEEYDLEWTFINDYGISLGTFLTEYDLTADFRWNATRITTTNNYYSIPLIFDHGWIAVRVRPNGRKWMDFEVPIFGKWSVGMDSPSVYTLIANGHHPYHNELAHENGLNWQVTSTFAEEGKHKEVISYFDGTLRNRQTVTRLSSSGIAVVGESIYDFHGRPAIQILPAPVVTSGCDEEASLFSSIKYYRNFNLNTESSPIAYNAFDFDLDMGSCGTSTPGLSTSSGAGQYYSSSNPNKLNENAFIPDASKSLESGISSYPFTQVEYTADNSGRVRNQTGVGYDYQLNSGHETNYIYGVPHQIQLDRLFGSEAGYYEHYKKNAVRDPNGQVSISYLDMRDKVIATALVGPSPENLEPIESSLESLDTLTSALINSSSVNPGSNYITGNSIVFNYQLLVPFMSAYTFDYSLEIPPLSTSCIPDFCLHCVYDLSLSITNDCGEIIWPTNIDNVSPVVGNFTYSEIDSSLVFTTSCEVDTFSYDYSFTINSLPFGEYTIHKELTINSEARDFYLSEFLNSAEDTCMLDSATFINNFLNQIDTAGCAIDYGCVECLQNLGDRDAYIATGPNDFTTNALVYDWNYEECIKLCEPLSPCMASYSMMLADVAKDGQYGEYLVQASSGPVINPGFFPLSVFNEENHLAANETSSPANWRAPSIVLNEYSYPFYLNNDGTRSKIALFQNGTNYVPHVENTTIVYLNENGNYFTYPENLTHVADFIVHWQMSWAKSLVKYHPEYCYYKSCSEYNKRQSSSDYITSDQFDDLLQQTNSMSDAVSNGLVTLTGGPIYTVNDWFLDAPSGTWPFDTGSDEPYDPFVVRGDQNGEIFSGDGIPYYYGRQLDSLFFDYNGLGTGLSMVALATYTAISQVDPTNAVVVSDDPHDWEDAFGASIGTDPTTNRDNMWNTLKSLYLGAKRQLQNERENAYAINECSGYNGCFQSSSLGQYSSDFSALTDTSILNNQPCNSSTRLYYVNKVPRFPDVEQTIPSNYDNEQCSNELNLQNLLNALISAQLLTNDTLSLDSLSAFAEVFSNVAAYTPAFDSTMVWVTSEDADTLVVQWIDSLLEVVCEIHIEGDSSIGDWDSLYYVDNLQFIEDSTFSVKVWYWASDSTLNHMTLNGWSDCLASCDTVITSDSCQLNNQMRDMLVLMNKLIDDGVFNHANVSMSTYTAFLTPAILAEFPLGVSPSALEWTGSPTEFILQDTFELHKIWMTLISFDPATLTHITEITSVDCRAIIPGGVGGFATAFYCQTTLGPRVIYSDGEESAFKNFLCDCIEPPSPCCQGIGYAEFFHVKSFVEEMASDAGAIAPNHDPSQFSNLIGSYIPSGNYYTYSMSTAVYHDTVAEVIRYMGSDSCNFELYLYPETSGIWDFNYLPVLNILDFHLTGTPDAQGNRYSFAFTAEGYHFAGSWCIPMKECTSTPPCGTIPPLPPPVSFVAEDPCVDLLTNVAIANGLDAYNIWYAGYVENLVDAYNQHCLNNVTENLTATFEDKEYHYTLYYYDQSGNLVRTVPPAGVNPLPISSSFDSLAMNIDEDRLTGQRRIYTFHNLATTYTYNSLNQLVHQAIPDHDKMDIWETSLTNGLPNKLQTNEIQLINSAHGYLGGGYLGRGKFYETIDAGQMWKQVCGLVAADLKKVEMVNGTLGYAIGKDGVFLKTIDGGVSWDMLITYTKFDTVLPGTFTDFALNLNQGTTIVEANHGIILVGENGLLFKISYSSGVEQISRITSPTITGNEAAAIIPTFGSGWNFTSVEFAYNKFFIWVEFDNGFQGEKFSLPFSLAAGNGWFTSSTQTLVAESAIRPSDLRAIHQYAYRKAYSGGNGGRLYYCNNVLDSSSTYAQWFQVPTNHRYTFKKLHFYNAGNGIALLDEGILGSAGALYKTHDFGKTWHKVSNNEIFLDFYEYDTDPICSGDTSFHGSRFLAVGKNGLVARVTLVVNGNSNSVGMEVLSSPASTVQFNTCWAQVFQDCATGGDFVSRYFVAGKVSTTASCTGCGTIYTALVKGNNVVIPWQEISSDSLTSEIIDMEVNTGTLGGLYPEMSSVILDVSGHLHTLFITSGAPDCTGSDSLCNANHFLCPDRCSADYDIHTLGVTGSLVFTNLIRPQGSVGASRFVYGLTQPFPAADSVVYDLYRFDLGSGSATTAVNLTVSNPVTSDEMSIYDASAWKINSSSNRIVMVGRNGMNLTLDVSSTSSSTTWAGDDRYAIRPLSIYRQDYSSISNSDASRKMLAVGRNGNVIIRRLSNASSGVICWNLLYTTIKDDFTAIDYAGDHVTSSYLHYGLFGTENGKLYKWTLNDTASAQLKHPNTLERLPKIDLSAVTSPTTERINGIACIKTSSYDVAYACGNNGMVMRSATFSTLAFDLQPTGNVDYSNISLKYGSTNALLCGQNARIENSFGNSRIINNEVYIPTILDLHFIDAAEGYVLAEGWTLRHTTDGGNTWHVVLPTDHLGTATPILNKVAMKENGWAYCAGSSSMGSIFKITNNSFQTGISLTGLSGIVVTDMAFDASGTPWTVGYSGSKSFIASRHLDTGSWLVTGDDSSSTSNKFLALHIFPSNNSIMVCGTKGYVNLWSNNSWGAHSNYSPTGYISIDFNDIYFHDDLVGYIGGTRGILLKTDKDAMTLPNYNSSGLLIPFSSATWQRMKTKDNLDSETDSTKMQIYSMAFNNRWEGIWGGVYDVSSGQKYVRLIHDESEIFSTRFWYDRLGRISLSQNTKQYNYTSRRYSYTLYDELGRVSEAGEKVENTSGQAFRGIFGVLLEGYYNYRTMNDSLHDVWMNTVSGARGEVTHTYYDEIPYVASTLPSSFVQTNLNKRVACVTYENTWDNDTSTYIHATHYTYDVHGNVKTLIQDFPEMGTIESDERYKRLDYNYDLISGNVKQVSYQAGKPDQFYHCYRYDSDNRITDVYTALQGWADSDTDVNLNCSMPGDLLPFFEHDATYRYYLHGPLARTEIGDISVQGIDYTYTLQGWLKGVNSNTLQASRDIGRDGHSGPNQNFALDVYGFTLGYHQEDYTPIDQSGKWTTTTDRFEAELVSGNNLLDARSDLWNGNIGHMITALYAPPLSTAGGTYGANVINGMAYNYDQLNRIINAKGFDNINVSTNEWSTTSGYTQKFANAFTYDANGNILTQERSSASNVMFDHLTYHYQLDSHGKPIRNRLYHVNDAASSSLMTDDIDNMASFVSTPDQINIHNNYGYDALGQLMRDSSETIDNITWRVDGKIRYVSRSSSSTKKELGFEYDAMGNRVAKHIYSTSGTWQKSIYYVRDAQGNVMSVYEHTISLPDTVSELLQTELHLYGSSRIGMITPKENEMIGADDPSDVGIFSLIRGAKKYELTNHLGNVLSVITDRKEAIDSSGFVQHYIAKVVSYTDYYPFGVAMAERSWSGDYRYGFNGKESDDEAMGGGNSYDFGARMYDSRIGRWLSVDPLADNYPEVSPYLFCNGNPINEVDHDGASAVAVRGIFSRTIVIKMDLNFYGSSATNALAKQTALNIEQKWNSACGKVLIEGKEYKVKFKVRGKAISEQAAEKNIESNTDLRENFIRLGDSGVKVSSTDAKFDRSTAGSTGYWLTSELGRNNGNTDVHEAGHLMGWFDGIMSGSRVTHDYNGKVLSEEPCVVQPGTMTPKGYNGNNNLNEFSPFDSEYLNSNGEVDASKRADPSPADVRKLGINWDELAKSRKVGIGSTTRWYYKENGKREDKSQNKN